jgi:hypothetical protein
MKLIWTAGAAFILMTAVSGCRGHMSIHVPKPRHPVVVVRSGHTHTHKCGHYRHQGRWHIHRGHVHRRGCGHAWKGGVWIWVR